MKAPSPSDSLNHWLGWLEQLHPSEIEMGLDRVGRVADRMALRPSKIPLILVGGTNGKGSTVALLGEIYRHAGYNVGTYTSPHIELFNERMCVNGQMLSDQAIVDALHEVELARAPDTLTYFEYTTLAAMVAFTKNACDVAVMEVGLGGRLDATNLWDADCAILTSIALDHQSYLGDTREAVAFEKVAIGRAGKPMIVGEVNPPDNLISIAVDTNMRLLQLGAKDTLPTSALAGDHQQRNAACALLAINELQSLLPVKPAHSELGLKTVHVAGRFEQRKIDGQAVVFDVAHNPAAAETVRDALRKHYPNHAVYCVFSALQDKDIAGVVSALAPVVTEWFCASLPVPRATDLQTLTALLSESQEAPVSAHDTIIDAWLAAQNAAKHAATHAAKHAAEAANAKSVVLVAGSFFTLSELQSVLPGNTDSVASAPT